MECARCGCQGHGETWQVRCIRCGKDKWPRLPEKPVDYVCRLCRIESPRQAAGRKGAEAKRQKASLAGLALSETHDQA